MTWFFVTLPITLAPSAHSNSAPDLTVREFPLSEDVSAADDTSRPTETEGGFSYEDLDNMYEDWRSIYVEILTELEQRTSLYGSLRQTDRFGLKDQEILAGVTYPFESTLSGNLELTGSPSHYVLAQWSLTGLVQHEIGNGWLVHAGWRHAQFSAGSVNVGLAVLENYWKDFRASYTLYVAVVPEAGAGAAHRLSANWYYDDRSTTGISVSVGKEVENLGPAGIISTAIRSFVVSGRHWFASAWGVTYEAGLYVQGDLYSRRGFRLGFRYLI